MGNSSLNEREAFVVLKQCFEIRPAILGLEIEDPKIKSDELGIKFCDQVIEGALEFLVVEGVGESAIDGSFAIMLDAHAVAKSLEEFLLAFHEVNLEKMFADGVAGAKFKRFVKPGDLLGHRLFLDENGAQIAVGGQGGNRRLVELTVILSDPEEHIAD